MKNTRGEARGADSPPRNCAGGISIGARSATTQKRGVREGEAPRIKGRDAPKQQRAGERPTGAKREGNCTEARERSGEPRETPANGQGQGGSLKKRGAGAERAQARRAKPDEEGRACARDNHTAERSERERSERAGRRERQRTTE